MRKSICISIFLVMIIPLDAYLALQYFIPSDPDVVYVKSPSLFSAKWEKVAEAENFSEYLDRERVLSNTDSTVSVVSMRNYSKGQSNKYGKKEDKYKSIVLNQTIDCFNGTIETTKMYLIEGHFAKGSLIDEPVELIWKPVKPDSSTISGLKIKQACEIANKPSSAVDSRDWI